MQKFNFLQATTTLKNMYQQLVDTLETILSNNSGTARPTSNLRIGMKFFNETTQVTETLVSLAPAAWVQDDATLGGELPSYYAGLAQGSSGQDPNLAVTPNLLTNHANSPGLGLYWHITTTFYSTISSTSNRSQIAVSYYGAVAQFALRHCYNGVWTPWVPLANHIADGVLTVADNLYPKLKLKTNTGDAYVDFQEIAFVDYGDVTRASIVAHAAGGLVITTRDDAGTVETELAFADDGNLRLNTSPTPTDYRDLTTKEYVDDRVLNKNWVLKWSSPGAGTCNHSFGDGLYLIKTSTSSNAAQLIEVRAGFVTRSTVSISSASGGKVSYVQSAASGGQFYTTSLTFGGVWKYDFYMYEIWKAE